MIATAVSKSLDTEVLQPDMRGTNSKYNRITEETINEVVLHIKMFKTVPSHYCRKDTQYEFLPRRLNKSKMHRLNVSWCDKKGFRPVNKDTYRTIFREKFKLKFNVPKKDLCDHCEIFKNTPDEQKTDILKAQHEQHLKEKDLTRDHMRSFKELANENKSIHSAGFDF